MKFFFIEGVPKGVHLIILIHSCTRGITMSGQVSGEQPLVVAKAAHLTKVFQAPASVVLDGHGRSSVLINSQGKRI